MGAEIIILIVAIIVFIIAMMISIARYLFLKGTQHLVCPKCKVSFKPTFFSLLFSVDTGNEILTKCPQCHEREFITPTKDK